MSGQASKLPSDLVLLIEQMVNGQISERDFDRLNAILAESGQARQLYRRYMNLHTALACDLGSASQIPSDMPALNDEESKAAQALAELYRLEQEAPLETVVLDQKRVQPSGATKPAASELTGSEWLSAGAYLFSHTIRSKAGGAGALAAILVLGFVLYVAFTGQGDSTATPETANNTPTQPGPIDPLQTNIVATLTAERDAQWAGAASATPAPGDTLRAGERFTLTLGFAEITTHRGAVAILEAPATIELLDNDNAIRLHAGRLVGICETEDSKGFLVRTPSMDVIDLGTRFGIDVADNMATEVHVFEGEVQAQRTHTAAYPKPMVLTAGQSARSTPTSDQVDRIAYQPELFAKSLPSTVAAARINDGRFTVEVVPFGVQEDIRLHTDRSQQINGLDASGIPQELIGGDLVRTPADAKPGLSENTDSIRIDIELARQADIYLIASNSAFGQLDWVKRDYELTQLQLGRDDGNDGSLQWKQSINSTAGLGVGPGNSVDKRLWVWKRTKPAIHHLTTYEPHRSIQYAIIAVPRDR